MSNNREQTQEGQPQARAGEPSTGTSGGDTSASQTSPQSSTTETGPATGAGLFLIERVEGTEIITGKTIPGKQTYEGWEFPEDRNTFRVPAYVATVMIATGSFREVPQGPARLKKGD